MKNLLFVVVLMLSLTVVISSCQKEALSEPSPQFKLSDRDIPIPELPLVDLKVNSVGTNMPGDNTTIACGGTHPNVSCEGGIRQFLTVAKLINNGRNALPPGSFEIEWRDQRAGYPDAIYVQTFRHDYAINPGFEFPVSYITYMGDCNCSDGIRGPALRFIKVTVDPANRILEENESNNEGFVSLCDDDCIDD